MEKQRCIVKLEKLNLSEASLKKISEKLKRESIIKMETTPCSILLEQIDLSKTSKEVMEELEAKLKINEMDSKRARSETRTYIERRSYGKKQKMDPEIVNKRKIPEYIPPNAVIIDNGAHTIKIGYSENETPVTFPNCIMKAKSEKKRFFIGDQIEDCHDLSGLYYLMPHERGYITKYDIQKTIWDYVFNKYPITDETVVMTQPLFNFRNTQEYMDEIFFEEYEVKSLYRANGTDYSYYNYRKRIGNVNTSCLVVDSGHSFTHIVPYINGVKYASGILRMDVGGKLLTNYLKDIISYRQLHVMEETYVINQVKEDVCYMALDFKKEMNRAKTTNDIVQNYVLPDFHSIRRGYIQKPDDQTILPENCQILRLNNERISVPELLMKPSIIPGIEQAGLAQCIFKSINRCPSENRAALARNIVLTGGNCAFPGFKSRIEAETRMFLPCEHRLGVFQPDNPGSYAWDGAKNLSADPKLLSISVTKEEYEEFGSKLTFERFNKSLEKSKRKSERIRDVVEPKKFSYLEHLHGIDLFKKKAHPNALRKPDVEFILEGEDIEKFDHQYVTLEIDHTNKRKDAPIARVRLTEEFEDEQFELRKDWIAKRKKRLLIKSGIMASKALSLEMKKKLLASDSSDSSDDRIFDEILTSDETGLRRSPVKTFTPVFRKPSVKVSKLKSVKRRALRKKQSREKALAAAHAQAATGRATAKMMTGKAAAVRSVAGKAAAAGGKSAAPQSVKPQTVKSQAATLHTAAPHAAVPQPLATKAKAQAGIRTKAPKEMLPPPIVFKPAPPPRKTKLQLRLEARALKLEAKRKLAERLRREAEIANEKRRIEEEKQRVLNQKYMEEYRARMQPRVALIRSIETIPVQVYTRPVQVYIRPKDTIITKPEETTPKPAETITSAAGPAKAITSAIIQNNPMQAVASSSNTQTGTGQQTITTVPNTLSAQNIVQPIDPARTTIMRPTHTIILRPIQPRVYNNNNPPALRPTSTANVKSPPAAYLGPNQTLRPIMVRPSTAGSPNSRPQLQPSILRGSAQASMLRPGPTQGPMLRPIAQAPPRTSHQPTILRGSPQSNVVRHNTTIVRSTNTTIIRPIETAVRPAPQTVLRPVQSRQVRPNTPKAAKEQPAPRPAAPQQRTTQIILSGGTLNPAISEAARNQLLRSVNQAGPRCVTINSSQLLGGPVSTRSVSLASNPLLSGTPTTSTRSININANQLVGHFGGARSPKPVNFNANQLFANPATKSININANQLIGGPSTSRAVNVNVNPAFIAGSTPNKNININANQIVGNSMQIGQQSSTSKNLTVQLIPFNTELLRQSGHYIITKNPNKNS